MGLRSRDRLFFCENKHSCCNIQRYNCNTFFYFVSEVKILRLLCFQFLLLYPVACFLLYFCSMELSSSHRVLFFENKYNCHSNQHYNYSIFWWTLFVKLLAKTLFDSLYYLHHCPLRLCHLDLYLVLFRCWRRKCCIQILLDKLRKKNSHLFRYNWYDIANRRLAQSMQQSREAVPVVIFTKLGS